MEFSSVGAVWGGDTTVQTLILAIQCSSHSLWPWEKSFVPKQSPGKYLYPSCKNSRAPQRLRAMNLLPSLGLGGHGIRESVSLNGSFCGKDWCYQQQRAGRNRKPSLEHIALNFP